VIHLGTVGSGVPYDDEVRQMDSSIGVVLDEMRRLGLDRRATVAMCGTCGRDLGEHEGIREGSLHAPVTRVPLMVRFPGGTGSRFEHRFVESIDLLPTLLEITATGTPPSIQGRSLVPVIRGDGTPPYVAFGESEAAGVKRRFVALGGYRLHLALEPGSVELFRLPDDPAEIDDRSCDPAESHRIAVLRDHLSTWEKMVAAASLDPGRRTESLDDDDLEKLRSLGYLR
jgi:arylsulfatase A-like enzyme